MGLFVKICGLARAADVAAVARLAPDALGFVFWPGSRRAVRAEEVRDWVRGLPAHLLKVGVFVDAPADEVRRTVETAGLDVAQLHGGETPEDFADVPFRLWRSVSLRPGVDPHLDGWFVDAFLVDSYSPQSPGGTGQVGDWAAARDFVRQTPQRVLLAGGLTPGNVRAAAQAVRPWGVDVSSGVEARPREKDLAKVKAFIEQCRAA